MAETTGGVDASPPGDAITTGVSVGRTVGPEEDDDGDPPEMRFDQGGVPDVPDACEDATPTWQHAAPNVILLLDRSGSMSTSLISSAQGPITRWAALHDALTNTLPRYTSRVRFGAKLFPTATGCDVMAGLDVEPELLQASNILDALPQRSADLNLPTTAWSPTRAGIEATAAAARSVASEVPGATSILFVVDGPLTAACVGNDIDGAEDAIDSLWTDDQIPTDVVGLDLLPALYPEINRYAVAGGRPFGTPEDARRFQAVTDAESLEHTMRSSIEAQIPCDIMLDAVPRDGVMISFAINGVAYPELEGVRADVLCEDAGWRLDRPSGVLRLCGEVCDLFRGGFDPVVTYTCEQQ